MGGVVVRCWSTARSTKRPGASGDRRPRRDRWSRSDALQPSRRAPASVASRSSAAPAGVRRRPRIASPDARATRRCDARGPFRAALASETGPMVHCPEDHGRVTLDAMLHAATSATLIDPASPTVLVIEDDPANRALLTAQLERAGYRAATAADGPSGLAAALETAPDVVLLDIGLPGMDGLEICRRLRADPRTVAMPVVLLTGRTSVDDVVAGLDAGADDFLAKPYHEAELLARLRSARRLALVMAEMESAQGVVAALANAVEAKDTMTEHHCQRLAGLAHLLATAAELDPVSIKGVVFGALLHDIGKIGISDGILKKPGALTDDEWIEMRRHPIIGEQICRPLASSREFAPIVRHHHERWDGGGYPDRLKGEEIPIGARIVGLVDAFDAIVHDRPYREAGSIGERRSRRSSPRPAATSIPTSSNGSRRSRRETTSTRRTTGCGSTPSPRCEPPAGDDPRRLPDACARRRVPERPRHRRERIPPASRTGQPRRRHGLLRGVRALRGHRSRPAAARAPDDHRGQRRTRHSLALPVLTLNLVRHFEAIPDWLIRASTAFAILLGLGAIVVAWRGAAEAGTGAILARAVGVPVVLRRPGAGRGRRVLPRVLPPGRGVPSEADDRRGVDGAPGDRRADDHRGRARLGHGGDELDRHPGQRAGPDGSLRVPDRLPAAGRSCIASASNRPPTSSSVA